MTLSAEDVKRMIISALESMEVSSANPTHINKLIQVNNIETPPSDPDVGEGTDTSVQSIKEDKKVKNTVDKVKQFEEGSVGKIQALTADQVGNLSSFAKNPFTFMTSAVFRKFTKGAGIAALAVIIFEAVKSIVLELFAPGRLFDTQFRERIDRQILLFITRKEQRELRQGTKQIITTTIGGLRGDALQGQIGGNFYNPLRIPFTAIDPRRASFDNIIAQDPRERTFQTVGAGGARSARGGR